MKMKYLFTAAALTLLAGVASAGQVLSVPVFIDLDDKFAQGDQWTARSSDNDVEVIGCLIRINDDGAGGVLSIGTCQAVDSAGVGISCGTLSADLIAAIHTVTAFAYIQFRWDENFECTHIGISTNSFYIPDFELNDDDSDSDSDSD